MLASLAFLFVAKNAPGRFVFVRHAETQANATGRYNSRTINAFSDLGKKQVEKLTANLDSAGPFDEIVVSPSERALRTLAPYLRSHHRTATVWPDLYECCDGNTRKVKGPTSRTLKYGPKFVVPADIRPLFRVEAGQDRLPLAPSYEDGLIQIRVSADRIRREVASGHRILVVGHSLHGGRMIELLEGKPMTGRTRPGNTQIMGFVYDHGQFIYIGAPYRYGEKKVSR